MKLDLGICTEYAVPMISGRADVQENFFIGIKDGRIEVARVFKGSDVESCKEFRNLRGMVAIPGLVNGHTHLPMTLMRGIEDDSPLNEWLFQRILPLEGRLVRPDFVRLASEMAAAECIRFGTTTVNDMYFYPSETVQVWDEHGLRGLFAQVMNSFPMPEDKDLGADREGRFWTLHKKYRNHPRIKIGIGPHAPYTCKDDVLLQSAEISKKAHCVLHIHLAETEHEVASSQDEFRESPVRRLQRLGVLSSRTTCAHSIHLSDADIKILKETGASVIYNPDSNAKLGSGVAPLPKYFAAGVPVSLGTDGSVSNNDLSMFGAMDLGCKLQKLAHKNPAIISAADALRMATYEGAKALGLEKEIGSLEVGKKADITIVDFNFPHLTPILDVVSNLVYSCQGLEVDTVLCEGKILLSDKQFAKIKTHDLFEKARSIRKHVLLELEQVRKEHPSA